jgi:hypothetical protein
MTTSELVASGTQAGLQLQALFQSVLTNPVQVILTLPGPGDATGVQGLYVTTTFVLLSLTQVFVPVHRAKKVFVAVIAGVLLGKATVLFDKSYQVIVEGELQPVAVSVVVLPETEIVEGVAVGLFGDEVELITTSVVAEAVQPFKFVTVNI